MADAAAKREQRLRHPFGLGVPNTAMSQAQCTAEVEAWLVRNNFTAPQRAHLLQQVDALSDFSEAVDEDIPAITEGWSSLARSKLRRCVAAL